MSAPGYLRPDELMTVQGAVQLVKPTAHAFLAMRDDAAERDHVNITIATPAGGYRSHAMDVDMHDNPKNYNINPALVSGLYPVGKSKHALGTEVDIAAGLAWVIRNGARYGFTRTEVAKGDLNHFHHDGITFAGASGQPIQLPKEDDTMLWKVSAPHRGIALMGPHLFRSLSPAQGNAEVNAADLLTDAEHRLSVSDAQFDTLRDILTRNDPRADGRAEFRTEPAKP